MKEANKKISLQRAQELKSSINDYLEERDSIQKGLELKEDFNKNKKRILQLLNATEKDWEDWHWQMNNQIRDAETLSKIVNLTKEEKGIITTLSKKYRWAVSPYYASLMNPDNPFDPIRLMGLPSAAELLYDTGEMDPMGEEFTNPAGTITRRYPDRLIVYVTNRCANFCRFCQRRRNIGGTDRNIDRDTLQQSIDYIRDNEEIRDVLITGGDPLTLETEDLEWIISRIRDIDHVEIIRIGSRTPVTLPQRMTEDLCDMLKKYHPLYINTHFNNPKEVTHDSKRAAEMLSFSGIPLGNQMVLLNGVNNNKYIVECLNHELLKIRIRPYYIFHTKQVRGTGHFMCSIDEGLEIMEHLRGRTSGLAIPTYIVNAPKGLGKTPILPNYIISRGKDNFMLRTWEGKVCTYTNKPTKDMKEIILESRKKLTDK